MHSTAVTDARPCKLGSSFYGAAVKYEEYMNNDIQAQAHESGWRYSIAPSSVLLSPDLSHTAKCVFWGLCYFCRTSYECFPSIETLAETLRMSESTVKDGIGQLESYGFITVERSKPVIVGGKMKRLNNRYSIKRAHDLSGSDIESPRAEIQPQPTAEIQLHPRAEIQPISITHTLVNIKHGAAEVLSRLAIPNYPELTEPEIYKLVQMFELEGWDQLELEILLSKFASYYTDNPSKAKKPSTYRALLGWLERDRDRGARATRTVKVLPREKTPEELASEQRANELADARREAALKAMKQKRQEAYSVN